MAAGHVSAYALYRVCGAGLQYCRSCLHVKETLQMVSE